MMAPMSEADQAGLRKWMAVGIRVAALDAADPDAAPTLGVRGTVVEVFDDRVRVLGDDDSVGFLFYDRDDWGMIIGHAQDDLPHGYRLYWEAHPWVTGCPKCWSCARTAAEAAHARGEEDATFESDDGHGAGVQLEYPA